jgi:hypothetical protein
LNLSKRTVDKGETDATAAVEKMDVKDEGEGANAEGGEEGAPAGEERNRREREPRKFREPEVVNSRAAMLGEAAAPRKEVCSLHWIYVRMLLKIFDTSCARSHILST